MAQTSPRRFLKLRVIVIALAVFAILHVLLMVAVRAFASTPERLAVAMPLLNVLAYVIYLIVGFIAALLRKSSPIMHGVFTGLVAAVIAVVFFSTTQRDFSGVVILLLNGVIFGGMGARVRCCLAARSSLRSVGAYRRSCGLA